jgi:phthiodiolone/phenolphthiodiolone dimycocerosates ketoreductase
VPTTAVPLNTSLYLPPATFGETCRQVAESGAVDELFVWDQIANFWPPHMWTPDNTPMARVIPDIDSYADAFAMAAYALATVPEMGLSVSSDAIRRGPAELSQMMWTLANMTESRATLHIGAGEVKQTYPAGWKRAEGLARLEDHLRIARALWDSDEPVEYEGNSWKMRRLWLGGARKSRPRVWALGGGPKLYDLATSYADGIASAAPCVFDTPEEFARTVRALKQDLERKGRDPEAFGFGLWFLNAIHEDHKVILRSFEGPLMRWHAGTYGRFNNADWSRLGLESVWPEEWHYSLKMRPVDVAPDVAERVIARTTEAHCEAAFSYGTPAEVATEIGAYVDAGATFVAVCDFLPFVLEPDDAALALPRSLEVLRRLKLRG